MMNDLPVAVIGAGPVGLAAAAHLLERGLEPLVFEAGAQVGASVRQWGHVRMFSPWAFNIDGAAARLLARHGWVQPDPAGLPTGADLLDRYLLPLAATPDIAPRLRLGTRVTALSRRGFDKVKSAGRARAPFVVRHEDAGGIEREVLARAVIDASGTWRQPNPVGAGGLPARGERSVRHRIAHGIPDVTASERSRYAGKRILLVGSGHSALNVLLDLVALKAAAPATQILWALRQDRLDRVFGGGAADQLPARGELGQAARRAVADASVELLTPFHVEQLGLTADGAVFVKGDLAGRPMDFAVDEIVVATGFRPDLDMLRELRLGLDPWLEAPVGLAPLIDPNLHSCGTVRPHGARELSHPETDFYIAGMKAYGRAPTFLLATGHEQVRSIAAELAGDREAAARVELSLPETGVCSAPAVAETAAAALAGAACCGPRPVIRVPAEDGRGCGAGASSCGTKPAARVG